MASTPIFEVAKTRKSQEVRRKLTPDGSAQFLDRLRDLVGFREELTLARHYIDNIPCEIQSEQRRKLELRYLVNRGGFDCYELFPKVELPNVVWIYSLQGHLEISSAIAHSITYWS